MKENFQLTSLLPLSWTFLSEEMSFFLTKVKEFSNFSALNPVFEWINQNYKPKLLYQTSKLLHPVPNYTSKKKEKKGLNSSLLKQKKKNLPTKLQVSLSSLLASPNTHPQTLLPLSQTFLQVVEEQVLSQYDASTR